MRIRHREGTMIVLAVGGEVYQAIAPGRFDVPYAAAQQLIRWPDWELDTEPLEVLDEAEEGGAAADAAEETGAAGAPEDNRSRRSGSGRRQRRREG